MNYDNLTINEQDTQDKLSEDIARSPIRLDGLEELLDEEDANIKVSIYNCKTKRMVTDAIKRSMLTPEALRKALIRNNGVCPNIKAIRMLAEMFETQINRLLMMEDSELWSEAHKTVGFIERDGILEFDSDGICRDGKWIPSHYYGKFDIQQKGSLAAIQNMFAKLVAANSPAVPLSILGAASTVLSYSNKVWGTSIYNPIVHLLGNSSRGKSTVAKLLSSFGGNPEGSNGFFLTFLATTNAILKRIGNVFGYTFTIDEFSTARSTQGWSDFIYTLSNGFDKERCRAGGALLQQAAQFEGIFVSTGEISISDKCNKNEGIKARLFEIPLASFTSNAEESDMIKRVVKENYAILTPLIAQELMRNSKHYHQIYAGWKASIKLRIANDKILLNIADRVMGYMSIIMTAVSVLETVLQVSFNTEEIFDFYYTHFIIRKADEANIDIQLYERIKIFVSMNKNKLFPIMLQNGVPALDDLHIGYEADLTWKLPQYRHKDINGDYYDYLYIFPVDILEEYLSHYGFNDPKHAMRTLLEKKLLKYSRSGRATYDLEVEGYTIPTYAIWFKEPEATLDGVKEDLLNTD